MLDNFKQDLMSSLSESEDADGNKSRIDPGKFETLRGAYIRNGVVGLDVQLKFNFHGYVANANFTSSDLLNQSKLADLRFPIEWYPGTRMMSRTIHLHVGPTNSGKTYHALKCLEHAESGIYAGPLRLLAHEVYSRLNANGKPCSLITGDERILTEDTEAPLMNSCTVEMVPINTTVDVAVIDEIQMIGHRERGWAWTQALLGVKARELHLCGEERAVPLICELAAGMGEKLEIHHYERLSPLRTMSTSLNGNLKNLRKGDCVVVFSRLGIHALKKEIEKSTEKRVAVVYGSLPPETRAQQAKLFNDPNNDYDILVASDAIGMGLNLSIKRIIFESISKMTGGEYRALPVSEIKQIAGRAGRYRSAAQNVGVDREDETSVGETKTRSFPDKNLGLVTTLEKFDLPILQKAMQADPDPILTAGIFPPTTILQNFAGFFPPGTPFSYILLRLHELSRMHSRYHLCDLRDQIGIADVIHGVENLTVHDRIIFCSAPGNLRDPGTSETVKALATCVANQGGGTLLDIPEIDLDILDQPVTAERTYLSRLEALHKALILYVWLSYRFTGVFPSRPMAFYAKKLVEERIDQVLAEYSSKPGIRRQISRLREQALLRGLAKAVAEDCVDAKDEGSETALPLELGVAQSSMQAPRVDVPDERLVAAAP
ncbi:p-loop containing nucleoside triphosphate hydrolase protein [Lasallia pustulata]|nr:p-loop containing nucleoside triphosphate hydrolase protein [Lasallia pustulata]